MFFFSAYGNKLVSLWKDQGNIEKEKNFDFKKTIRNICTTAERRQRNQLKKKENCS